MENTRITNVWNDIIQSDNDKRIYQGLCLSNGLKVLLVSDPTSEKAAAALDVHVGSMSDPGSLPGLAHFLEHMLFLGTEKFPKENDYMQFILEHGGVCNAHTSSEHTTYYFDVAWEHLQGALDRFSQFFVSPLFNENATQREVNAVDSENKKNLKNDARRISQVSKTTANQEHPYCRFSSGNKKSLETIPKEEGIKVREELLKFHEAFYSSNIMCLTVLGRESIDELENIVAERFSQVRNKEVSIPEWGNPFGPNEVMFRMNIVPVKNVRQLKVTFPFPDLSEHYLSKPSHYVSHLVGHEGKGSLLSELKGKGWVNSLVAGYHKGAKGFGFFTVSMDLSEDGLYHVDDIISHIFQYLNMLQQSEPQEWIFNECRDIKKIRFRFKDMDRPVAFVDKVVRDLQRYPMREVLFAPYALTDFKPELIEMVLQHLNPDHIRVAVVSSSFEGKTDRVEEWYGTDYKVFKIPKESIEAWKSAGLNEKFHLPAPNEFIPSDFCVHPLEADSPSVPVLVHDDASSKLWFKQDDTYLLPKAYVYLELASSIVYMDPLYYNMTVLFASLLKDGLNEYAYDAEIAGLSYSINSTKYGIEVTLSGYNQKQPVLLKKILQKLTDFKIDQMRFELIKEKRSRTLKNFASEQPHLQAAFFTDVIVREQEWTKEELSQSLEGITVDRMNLFIQQFLSKLHIQSLIHGNVTKQEAIQMVEMVKTILQEKTTCSPLLPCQVKRQRAMVLPNRCSFVFHHKNIVHKVSAVELYLQTGLQSTSSNMLLELFCQIIKEPAFNVLRTTEQLSYIVRRGPRRHSSCQGLHIVLQSPKSSQYLESRIEAFLYSMKSHIEQMSAEDFQKHVTALVVKRSEKPKRLGSEASKHWYEIKMGYLNFYRDEIEVEYLKSITKSDIIRFYDDLIAVDAPRRHKLTVFVQPPTKSDTEGALGDGGAPRHEEDVDGSLTKAPKYSENMEITNLSRFKHGQALCPLPVPSSDHVTKVQ